MQPNNPYQQPQVPSDYLDQISSTQPVKTLNPFVLWGLIGGLLIVAIVAVSLILSAGGDSSASLTSTAARFAALQDTTDDAQENLQNSDLRTLNSSLTLVLTNTNRDLAEPLKEQDIKLKDKKNKTISAVTADFEALKNRLEDARLNAVFDRTYAREMTFQLKTLQSDMAVLYKKTNSSSLRTALQTADANLDPIVEGFSTSNAL
jgi:hypothetical protein